MYGHAPQQWELASKILFSVCQLWKCTTCSKDPNSTESVEEAPLKAWGPMPCALLIVTSTFLSTNSDWWVHWGGGVFFRGDGGVWWWKTLCSSPISPVRRLTWGIEGQRAFGALSMDTGLVSPYTPLHKPHSHNIPPTKHSSAASSHLFFTVIPTSMNCPPPLPVLWHLLYSPSRCPACFPWCSLSLDNLQ